MFAIIYDLADLTEDKRKQSCRDYATYLGLNPDENRIDTIWMNNDVGRSLVAYCRRGTTDLLRGIHNIDVTQLVKEDGPGYVSYQASGINARGRKEIAVGAYTTTGLTGDRLAAAVATAETRATRRLTLKFVGGGLLDETEVHSQPVQVDTKPVAAPVSQPTTKPNTKLGKEAMKVEYHVPLPPHSGETVVVIPPVGLPAERIQTTVAPAPSLFDPAMLEKLKNSPTNDLPKAPEPLSEPALLTTLAVPATVQVANAIIAAQTPSEPEKPKRGRKRGSKNKVDMGDAPKTDGVETTQPVTPNADIPQSQGSLTSEPPTGQLLTYVPFCPDCPAGTHMAADDRLDLYLCIKHGRVDTTMKPSVVPNVKPEPVLG